MVFSFVHIFYGNFHYYIMLGFWRGGGGVPTNIHTTSTILSKHSVVDWYHGKRQAPFPMLIIRYYMVSVYILQMHVGWVANVHNHSKVCTCVATHLLCMDAQHTSKMCKNAMPLPLSCHMFILSAPILQSTDGLVVQKGCLCASASGMEYRWEVVLASRIHVATFDET
eukprot:NODE_2031_length_783_cov_60.335150_g1621_i0.p1 GENE.NODE_2031_length_783_cov_60.335150_g1621_i0~~NODE_2031_length_783_cov_60.335150_g1621_i0.p1  ORF type:complete len:168 (+),score=9.09 NODE_2031_length_783_cov_60.335150_g1621_i0:209-712(+)